MAIIAFNAALLFAQPSYANDANETLISFGETETYEYYPSLTVNNFLQDNGFTEVLNAQIMRTSPLPNNDEPTITRIFTNETTGQWLRTYETYSVPHAYSTMGYMHFDEPQIRIAAYGSFFQLHLENQGEDRHFYNDSNHGLCENIASPSWFYSSTNMIFQGLDEAEDEPSMTYVFSGTGGMIQPHTTGYTVTQRANQRCLWTSRFFSLSING